MYCYKEGHQPNANNTVRKVTTITRDILKLNMLFDSFKLTNAYYSQKFTVTAPIWGNARQTSGDMYIKKRYFFQKHKSPNETIPCNMSQHVRSPLAGNKEERSSLLLAGQRVEPEVIEEETRVSKSKQFTQQENSDNHTHPFHFSTVANHQTTALKGDKKGRKKPRAQISHGGQLSSYKVSTCWSHLWATT